MVRTREELIAHPENLRPHVVLLGAGASRAAFPSGDAAGLRLPVMEDLVDVVGLRELVSAAGIEPDHDHNFELIYSRLMSEPALASLAQEAEQRIKAYFSTLSLPTHATLYDRLLLSLRAKDAVFSFNWDPFLFDAYARNRGVVPLPDIFFLHGNVRVGVCHAHNDHWGPRGERCAVCHQPLTPTSLLYPIPRKNYSGDPLIKRGWDAAKELLPHALTLTIFGYGAPASDVDAVTLLQLAWFGRSDRTLEHVEIIDIASIDSLAVRWSPFTPTHHLHVTGEFATSRLARWPRRSCESLIYPMSRGVPCEDFPLPETTTLAELHRFTQQLARFEDCRGPSARHQVS